MSTTKVCRNAISRKKSLAAFQAAATTLKALFEKRSREDLTPDDRTSIGEAMFLIFGPLALDLNESSNVLVRFVKRCIAEHDMEIELDDLDRRRFDLAVDILCSKAEAGKTVQHCRSCWRGKEELAVRAVWGFDSCKTHLREAIGPKGKKKAR